MLSNVPAHPTLPASDLARAKKFYQDKLGLTIKSENEGGIIFACGQGTELTVYPSSFAGTNKATAAEFTVDDLAAEMADLRGRGITFEEYDFPGLKTVNGVADFGGDKGAWFKDTEGNILSLFQPG